VKTRKKGIIFFAVVAGIMLSSGVTIAINPGQWLDDSSDFDEMTAEELDAFDLDALGLELGYSGDELSQFCSANELAGSNEHVKEYKIPTACTQPLAITVDHNGIVWFAQTNTGKVAKFDPLTETFTEYDNSVWKKVEKIFIANAIENNVEPKKLRSMMWGMDYFPDGSVWFTDEATDAIWKFSIDDESYDRISYSQTDEGKSSLPQKLVIEGSKIIINDFTGGRLSFLDYAQDEQGLLHYAIPSVMEDAVTSDFAIDSDKNVWYTNWVPGGQGILVKFDYPGYEFQSTQGEVTQGLLLLDFNETTHKRFLQILNSRQDLKLFQKVTKEEATEISGIPVPYGGLFFKDAGWLNPNGILKHMLNSPRIKLITGEVTKISKTKVFLDHKDYSFDHICLCSSFESNKLINLKGITKKRGQITYLKKELDIANLKIPICAQGYISPTSEDVLITGSTYSDSDNEEVTLEENLENIERLKLITDQKVKVVDSNFGYRSITQDRLPLLGKSEDIFINISHGSRGTTSAPISAQFICDLIDGSPPIFGKRLIRSLDPERFIKKS